jgi:hypothetical protein
MYNELRPKATGFSMHKPQVFFDGAKTGYKKPKKMGKFRPASARNFQ